MKPESTFRFFHGVFRDIMIPEIEAGTGQKRMHTNQKRILTNPKIPD